MRKQPCLFLSVIQHRFFRLATVVLLFVLGSCVTTWAQNASDLRLVPFPKEVQLDGGQRLSLKSPLELHVFTKEKGILGGALIDELKRAGLSAPRVVETQGEFPLLILMARGGSVDPAPSLPEQAGEGGSDAGESYAIHIKPNGIVCRGKSDIGLHYAVQTLRQLIRANVDADGTLPCMTIRDWPSMKYRCFQDDWTRGPSPKLDFIKKEIALGSEFKHNLFTYYMQNQFEYRKYPDAAPKDGALTQDELRQVVAAAREHSLEILGCQQSFSHSAGFLSTPGLEHLGEAGYILSPTEPKVYDFLNDLYSEHCSLTPFELFNVCCDETWDLAKKKPESIELAKQIGVGGVYVQHILKVHELLKRHNKRMMMWGDIIVQHPQELQKIPKDVVMLCWWYYEPCSIEKYEEWVKPVAESGFEFWVCPGQSNWSRILPQIDTYVPNIQKFVDVGIKHGTTGMLNTGWEDDGESLHGYNWHAIAWGAECAWNGSKTDYEAFNKRIGPVLFGVKGDEFAQAITLLAECQSTSGIGTGNGRFWNRDFLPLQRPEVVGKNARKILDLVQPAIECLEKTKKEATINAELLDSFLLGARRMELIGTRMLDGLDVSRRYISLASLDLSESANVKHVIEELEAIDKMIQKNRDAHTAIRTEFVRIWTEESKSYALDWTTKRYDAYDAWFAELQTGIRNAVKAFKENPAEAELPDIGLQGEFAGKTTPNRVVAGKLSPDMPWANPDALMRLGLRVEAGNVDRYAFPVELDVNLPESCIGKGVEAFELGATGTSYPIPAQLEPANHPQNPKLQRLSLLLTGMKKDQTTNIYVYFGLDTTVKRISGNLSTFDGDDGMKVIENDLVQIHLGAEGGHVYKYLAKDLDTKEILLDMTDPGNDSYHGFSDHGHADRSKQFDLVCMNNGPAMVRYGCYFDGELVKTLTVYAGLPVIDVITTYPTGYFWNFDDADIFAADGQTPGTYLFSNGKTGPTPPKGTSTDLQIKEPGVYWAMKTNEQGFFHSMATPEAPSRFVIGPGGGMGGVGIESSEARSHFVTFAWRLEQYPAVSIMDQIRETFNLKNQPVVIQYAMEPRPEQ